MDVTGLTRVQERAPKLRVDVEIDEAGLRLTFGKATVMLRTAPASSIGPGKRSGSATLVPVGDGAADAVLKAIAEAVGAEVPARPHPPGFCPPFAVILRGVHASSGKKSLLWITVEIGAVEGSTLAHEWHLVIPAGKKRGALHVELPRGAAKRDALLTAFALGIRDGLAPRPTPETDPACASATPWLVTEPLRVPDDLDLENARWGGSTLFATRREGEETVIVRIDGPGRIRDIGRVDSPDVTLYPSPTGAHLLVEICRGAPTDPAQATRELFEVESGQRTRLVDKHEGFDFGDTAAAVLWSADGARVALSGSSPLAERQRWAVLVYDLAAGSFVDATPHGRSFFPTRWDGAALCLHVDRVDDDALTFRWEPGRGDPLVDFTPARSPSGRFELTMAEDRLRFIDRAMGACTTSLADGGGRFWGGDRWVTESEEPRVTDLVTGRYRFLAPPGRVLRPSFAEQAPRAVFHDGDGWRWGSAPELALAAPIALTHAAPSAERRAIAERRARRIEEASIVASEDPSGSARRALAALEARLRAEAAFTAGNARSDDLDAALGWYEAAVRDAPDFYEALYNCQAALARLDRAAERLQVTALLCERFPISSDAWLSRSTALHQSGDGKGALAAIERAMQLDADWADIPERRAATVDLLQQRARVHVAAGRTEAALADVRAALEEDPTAREQLLADEDLAPLRRHAPLRARAVKSKA